ncbi:DUF2680 domain-containing protein [Desulfitobacterium hafniense]|uniref:DUF2680 domain-containing protein n=2 Tax=Desulfitobacterium hafniense TaxID=49338 RepID=Q24NU1_DESHY|nr:DUF2680 domain-containing protein [Desulfitobacterium hafniense]BAE86301.1 hypothetical protein DSY4512 [Desulfitobacterium hafniense Y51]CDX04777.1 Protein of unknown function (DUF2680) [Desulfitobacterium hafniense]
MKKKIALGILTIALTIGGATAAFADTDLSKADELKNLYSQLFTVQKQIVDKQVEAGAMTKEEAEYAKNSISQNQEYRDQAVNNGNLGGFYGQHCGGYGNNMMQGYGNNMMYQGPSSTNYNF